MGRKTNKIISSVLLFVIMLSIFSVLSSADSPAPRRKMILDHFDNLYGNPKTAPNMSVTELIDGTCAYVAMSMLLSYYDTYWNDSIVPDNLEWDKGIYNSTTDVLTTTFNANTEYNDWDTTEDRRSEFVNNNKDKYLQAYLIDMCNRLPIIDELGVMAYQTQDLLQYYLYTDQGFTENQIRVNFYRAHNDEEKETMINMAQALIENGHPVIFSGFATDIFDENIDGDDDMFGGHSMIGYDYSGTAGNYDIKLNFCWNNGNMGTIRTSEFQYVNSIIWLEIDGLPHLCSDNYYDPDKDLYFCSCYIYYNTHPEHTNHHIYLDTYKFDDESHYKACSCGYKIDVHPHNMIYREPNAARHKERCLECDYEKRASHEYYGATDYDDTYHTTKCACGRNGELSEHYDYSYERNTTANHKVYCECGHYIGTRFHVVPAGNALVKFCIHCGERINSREDITPMPGLDSVDKKIYITDAGSYIDSDGVIYLVDSDMRLYLDGELDIYELAENATGYPSV